MNSKLFFFLLLCASLCTESYTKNSKQLIQFAEKVDEAESAFASALYALETEQYKAAKKEFEYAREHFSSALNLLEKEARKKADAQLQATIAEHKQRIAYIDTALDALHYKINNIQNKAAAAAFAAFAELNTQYNIKVAQLKTVSHEVQSAIQKHTDKIARAFRKLALDISMLLEKAVQKIDK